VSTSKGSSAQIIEGQEQYLLFNNFGKKADFVGERVSDVRKKKGQKNIHDKKLSKQEKQDNVIVVVQVPLKQKVIAKNYDFDDACFGGVKLNAMDDMMMECAAPQMRSMAMESVEEKVNVEAAMVSVAERTKPVCACSKELEKYQIQFAYPDGCGSVSCDECGKTLTDKTDIVYHCPAGKNYTHKNGYDLCLECGETQLQFDELRGLLDEDTDYKLERDERYPIRCTLQYYKATDNGAVNQEIMDDIVKQLESSQKQADFMGSLVTEYNSNRPTEWVNDQKDANDPQDAYKVIRNALKEHCGNDWEQYLANFKQQEVTDGDLNDLQEYTEDDLKELIPKMGPRKRFKKWVESL